VSVVIDPFSHERKIDELCNAIQDDLFKYKRIGHEVTVTQATQVPIELVVYAQLEKSALRAEVFRDLSNLFSSRDLGYGNRGFFHSDDLSFGQPIHVSELVSRARMIAGIKSVVIEKLARMDDQKRSTAASNFDWCIGTDSWWSSVRSHRRSA